MKKQGVIQIVFFISLIIAGLTIIFLGTEYLFHSDDATVVLVAREQILQKRLIIKEWNHSTVLWTVGLQTFVIPFLLFVKDWILCRELAVILQTVLFLIVVYKIMRVLEIREKIFFLALCILPVSEEILEHTFFQATYLTFQLFYYAILLFLICFYEKIGNKKKECFYGILCGIVIIASCHSNLASISSITVPILAAIILYYFIENYILFHSSKPDKRILYVISVLLIATAVGMGFYVLICRITEFDFANAGVNEFIGKSGYGLKITEYIDEFLLLYGAVGENALFSLEGILRIVRILYLILTCVLSPCYLIWNYKKLESRQKLFLLYSVAVYGILTVVALVTGKCSSRYFIPVYFNNIVLLGICCKYIKEKLEVFTKVIQAGIAIMAIGCCIFYATYDYQENKNDIGMWRSGYDVADKELVDFLEENEIHFIYAPYWNAYSNMVISDGNIQAMAYEENEPMKIKKWLNSNRWMQPEYYNGKTAVLFLPTVELDDVYWELASEYLQFGKWNILVFEQNLLLYDELAQKQQELNKEVNTEKIVFQGETLKYTGNAEEKDNSVYLYKEGIQKWSSCVLKPGKYQVTIQGENLKELSVFAYYLDETGRIMTIDMKNVHKKNHVVTYQILLEEERNIQFYEKNEINQTMRIDKIQVEKTK